MDLYGVKYGKSFDPSSLKSKKRRFWVTSTIFSKSKKKHKKQKANKQKKELNKIIVDLYKQVKTDQTA